MKFYQVLFNRAPSTDFARVRTTVRPLFVWLALHAQKLCILVIYSFLFCFGDFRDLSLAVVLWSRVVQLLTSKSRGRQVVSKKNLKNFFLNILLN